MQGVEVGDGLQHLAHHVAGVSLRVVALVQDPVKYLSACCTEGKRGPVMFAVEIYKSSFLGVNCTVILIV